MEVAPPPTAPAFAHALAEAAAPRAATTRSTRHVPPDGRRAASGHATEPMKPRERLVSAATSTCLEPKESVPQQRSAPMCRAIPRRLSFGPVTAANVEMLRKLNVSIFPVRYNDTFYDDVLSTPTEYTKFAYWEDIVVGAICCRFEPLDANAARQRVYIMTLGVLAPYRQCRIGRALLQSVIACARRDDVDHIYLHVQTNNHAALTFYRSFGFAVSQLIPNYYKRIKPPDCYVLVKRLG
ncbi:hypothetical protein P43SY_004499 [Pythium insidiosum]|uniref:N-acetyltransferase domain-containing protein n=1 Tax=Pythium insidiosum TaxID=114742 RepID=A0AAD5MAP9_PYTIN|nr:hypothetical protein P43SY_004499 [Pythium insidiosum]